MLAWLSSIINEGILIRYLCKMENSQCLQISKYVLQRPMLEQISKYKMKCLFQHLHFIHDAKLYQIGQTFLSLCKTQCIFFRLYKHKIKV